MLVNRVKMHSEMLISSFSFVKIFQPPARFFTGKIDFLVVSRSLTICKQYAVSGLQNVILWFVRPYMRTVFLPGLRTSHARLLLSINMTNVTAGGDAAFKKI